MISQNKRNVKLVRLMRILNTIVIIILSAIGVTFGYIALHSVKITYTEFIGFVVLMWTILVTFILLDFLLGIIYWYTKQVSTNRLHLYLVIFFSGILMLSYITTQEYIALFDVVYNEIITNYIP